MPNRGNEGKTFSSCYRIARWADRFEDAHTRKRKKVGYHCQPNTHSGHRLRLLGARPDGAAIYGAWCLILQVASRCPTRGVLWDGEPLEPADLAGRTGFPAEAFATAFKVLSAKEFGWILPPVADLPLASGRSVANLPLDGWGGGGGSARIKRSSSSASALRCSAVEGDRALNGSSSSLEDFYPVEPNNSICSAAQKTTKTTPLFGPVEAPAEIADPSPIVLTYPIVGEGGPDWHLRQDMLDELAGLYPDLDVRSCCRDALAWVLGHASRRKTARGMRRFLFDWIIRSVSQPRRATTPVQDAYARPRRGDLGWLDDWVKNRGQAASG